MEKSKLISLLIGTIFGSGLLVGLFFYTSSTTTFNTSRKVQGVAVFTPPKERSVSSTKDYLPPKWPQSIPIYPHSLLISSRASLSSVSIALETSDLPKDIARFYSKALGDDWVSELHKGNSSFSTTLYKKTDGKTLQITTTFPENSRKTTITLTLFTQ